MINKNLIVVWWELVAHFAFKIKTNETLGLYAIVCNNQVNTLTVRLNFWSLNGLNHWFKVKPTWCFVHLSSPYNKAINKFEIIKIVILNNVYYKLILDDCKLLSILFTSYSVTEQ